MANVRVGEIFEDLGRFKTKRCFKIQNKSVCEIKFSEGRLIILEDDLKRVCKKW